MIAKNKESSFSDLCKPQFFYEVVKYWVAFKLVQVLHKYGLNPLFKTNLNKWSKDLHCVVRFLKNIPQTDDEKKVPKNALTSFLNLKKKSTMDHSYVVNMARK